MISKRSGLAFPWGYEYQLTGTHFHDPNKRAAISIFGICFVAIFGTAIWAVVASKNSRPFRRESWGVLAFSILMYIIYLGNSFSRNILYEQEATVEVVYFLIDTILDSSLYLAEISLLGFIYIVIAACLQDLGVKAAIKTTLKVSSLAVICYLIFFWVTILALQIKYQVDYVIDQVDFYEPSVWTKVELTYYVIFVSASIELLALAMWIISGHRKQGNPTLIGIFLASLVAIPLLIRSLFNIGFLAASLTRVVKDEAQVAEIFITNTCFVLAYIGVLLVVTRFKKEHVGLVQHQTCPPQGSQDSAPNASVLDNGVVPHGGAPYGNPSYGKPQQPPKGSTADSESLQSSENDTVTAYQAQNQYNAQHSPVSPS